MHIYLIGYRGSGKSTVAFRLSQALNMPAVDTDNLIETGCRRSIECIFANEGEVGFRDRETAVIAQVSQHAVPTIVATGGGAILRAENREYMRTTGYNVWLQASAEVLFRRISADAASGMRRPNLTDHGGFSEVAEILAQREPLYRELAQLSVATGHKETDEVVAEICDWVKSQGQ